MGLQHFNPDTLRQLTTRYFEAAGWPAGDAAEVGRHFVLANLSGHDSHGVGMLPLYARAVSDGLLKPENAPVDRIDAPPFLVIDAHVALGQPTARRAVGRAAAMARAGGVAVLNLLNAHHIGRIGDYAEHAADAGLVSMFWVNVAGRPPIVAPHGAREARWGTNPHAVGVPDKHGAHLILDIATSRMAHGKARVALNKGEAVAEGYLIDAQGRPTTDPAVAFPPEPMGALLPFGDHKGAGIALMAEILSAGLGGGALIKDHPARSWIINSLFGVLIDPLRLGAEQSIQQSSVDAIARYVRSAAAAPGSDKVRAPGDREREMRDQRSRTGIPLDDETWRQIVAACETVGVDAAALTRA
jgi:hydroxycarboxylate dehydrogenase B